MNGYKDGGFGVTIKSFSTTIAVMLMFTAQNAHSATITCLEKRDVSSLSLEALTAMARPRLRLHVDTTDLSIVIQEFSKKHTSYCRVAVLEGKILQNDDHAVKTFINSEPFLVRVWTISIGGSVETAINMGQTLRKYLLITSAYIGIPPNIGLFTMNDIGEDRSTQIDPPCLGGQCICASACFLVWAGGILREGNYIGLHRPSIGDQPYGALSLTDAQSQYQDIIFKVRQYLNSVEVPPRLSDIMLETAKERIYILSDDPAYAVINDPYSVKDWLDANCAPANPYIPLVNGRPNELFVSIRRSIFNCQRLVILANRAHQMVDHGESYTIFDKR